MGLGVPVAVGVAVAEGVGDAEGDGVAVGVGVAEAVGTGEAVIEGAVVTVGEAVGTGEAVPVAAEVGGALAGGCWVGSGPERMVVTGSSGRDRGRCAAGRRTVRDCVRLEALLAESSGCDTGRADSVSGTAEPVEAEVVAFVAAVGSGSSTAVA